MPSRCRLLHTQEVPGSSPGLDSVLAFLCLVLCFFCLVFFHLLQMALLHPFPSRKWAFSSTSQAGGSVHELIHLLSNALIPPFSLGKRDRAAPQMQVDQFMN